MQPRTGGCVPPILVTNRTMVGSHTGPASLAAFSFPGLRELPCRSWSLDRAEGVDGTQRAELWDPWKWEENFSRVCWALWILAAVQMEAG